MLELNRYDPDGGQVQMPAAVSDPQAALSRLLLLARSDLARELTEDADPDQLIARVTALAHRLVPGAQGCAVALSADQEPMTTLATTSPLGAAIVDAEDQVSQGPSSDVMGRHGTVRIDDASSDARWPEFARRLALLGVHSLAVCDLPVTRRSRGILLVFSAAPSAFDDVAELILPVFASRASIALGHRDTLQNLTKAIDSRRLVGQAVGILMERHKIDASAAFDRLVRASQALHIKLHVIAQQMVDTGQEPEDVLT